MVLYEMLTGLPPWYTTDRDKLFERLRGAPLKFPFYVSRPAASIIQALLNRNPLQRLGANGGIELREHTFFMSLEWDALARREIAPPFNPCRNQDVQESENFEKEFTQMAIFSVDAGAYAMHGGQPISVPDSSETFLNFTFEEESFLESLREERFSLGGAKEGGGVSKK